MAYAKKRKQFEPNFSARLTPEAKDHVLSLLANMIITPDDLADGKVTRLPEMGRYQLIPSMLPEDMRLERRVLQIMIELKDAGVPATRENLLSTLALETQNAQQQLSGISEYRTADRDVEGTAYILANWMGQRLLVLAAEAILERASRYEGGVQQAYHDGLAIWNTVAPGDRSVRVVGQDFISNHRNVMDRRLASVKSGKPAGPSFPWKGLTRKIPNLKKGEMCTWMAKSKHGKSTLVLLQSENFAFRQGYDVAVFHLETSAESMADRWISRKLNVQTGALRDPQVFDHTKEPYKSAYDNAEAKWNENWLNKGHIYYVHCPGAGPSLISAQIASYKAQADARGKELIVIIDYLQKIDPSELNASSEAAGLNGVAHRMKNIAEAEETNCYMIMFAQYGVDQEYGDKKAAFGGQVIVQASQIVIRVERDDATEDLPVPGPGGAQEKDFIGVPMFFHQVGQPSSKSWFNVILANDDEAGPVPVQFTNGYFTCVDDQSRTASKDYGKKKKTGGNEGG